MKIIQKIIKKLMYDVCFELRPYEVDCIRHWQAMLPDDAKSLLAKQLDYFDMYSRQSKDKLVLFNSISDSRCQCMPKEYLFPLKTDSVACRMKLCVQNESNSKYTVEISIYEGRLFSIEFNRPPLIHDNKYIIEKVAIVDDVLKEKAYEPEDSLVTNFLFTDYLKRMNFDENFPVDKRHRDVLAKLDIEVPSDYLAFVSQSSCLKFGDCEIYPPSHIEKIVRPDANFYRLAEIYDRGCIAVFQDGKAFKTVYLDNEDDGPDILQNPFIKALTSIIGK